MPLPKRTLLMAALAVCVATGFGVREQAVMCIAGEAAPSRQGGTHALQARGTASAATLEAPRVEMALAPPLATGHGAAATPEPVLSVSTPFAPPKALVLATDAPAPKPLAPAAVALVAAEPNLPAVRKPPAPRRTAHRRLAAPPQPPDLLPGFFAEPPPPRPRPAAKRPAPSLPRQPA